MKICCKCKEAKSLNEFYKDSSRKDNLTPECKPCKKIVKDRYNSNNRDRINRKCQEYREANREKCNKAIRRWKQKNKHKIALYDIKRRRAKRQAYPSWLDEAHHWVIEEIYSARDDLTMATKVDHHVDHIVPLNGKDVCGLHVPWNLQVITAYENLSKGNKSE